ncbi:MAG: prefoldin subunit alpha [Candidatus Thermoplasmatota archaeon]|nr:prefoldin subunit alpha [Candidatus Thermoplasmatota archaeon]
MTDNEDTHINRRMEQGMAQMDQLKSQIETLTIQRDSLASVLLDHDRTIQVLEAMKEPSSRMFLLPMGGQVFVKARIEDMDRCIVDQGAGVLLERKIPEAIEQVKERQERIKGAVSGMEKTIQQLISQYQEITSTTQRLYDQQMRSGQGPDQTF